MVWEGLRDVKGQHKKGVQGYGEWGVGRECSTTLVTKGWEATNERGGHEREAVGRNGHTHGGGSWGWTVLEEGGPGLRQAWEGKGEQTRGNGVLEADGRVWSAEGRDLTLLIGMTKRLWWGPAQTGRGSHGRTKTAQGKAGPTRAEEGWRGRPRARQEGATTALCPSPACPAPSGGPKGSGPGRGGAEPGRYHSEQRGGLVGGGRSQGSEPCWGRGGAPHPGKKAWAHPERTNQRTRPGWRQGAALANGKGEHFGGSEEEKKKKKRPHETTIESVWGLQRLKVGVVCSTFQRLPSPFKDGVACITPGPRAAHGAEEGPGKVDEDWPFTGGT